VDAIAASERQAKIWVERWAEHNHAYIAPAEGR
jgi:hypothetical protein